MSDTRKHRRAPVSLKVRFKSATVDEFIEQYAEDISRGGIFIKSKSPMPVGTLLKFEFQLKDESRLIHGVGRVVWRREADGATAEHPAGMGIKFIKMDPNSRQLVQQIVEQRGGEDGEFESEAPQIQSARPPRPVKKTMQMFSGAPSAPPLAADAPFFPEGPPAELPDPEDRTQVRQASEFLASALSGADEDAANEAAAQGDRARQRTEQIQREREDAAKAKKLARAPIPREEPKTPAPPSSPKAGPASDAMLDQAIADMEEEFPDLALPEPRRDLAAEAQNASSMLFEDEATVVSEIDAATAMALADADVEPGAGHEREDVTIAAKAVTHTSPTSSRPPRAAPVPAEERSRIAEETTAAGSRKKSSMMVPMLVGAVALAGLGYVGYTMTQGDDPAIAADPIDDGAVETPPEVEPEVVPEPEPAGPTVNVTVTSSPAGAQVTVNGQARGETPAVVAVPEGEAVTLAVRSHGFHEESSQVTGEEGMDALNFELRGMSWMVHVETIPANARAVVDGRRITAPGDVNLARKPEEALEASISLRGYESVERTIEPAEFEETNGRMIYRLTVQLTEESSGADDPRPTVAQVRPTMVRMTPSMTAPVMNDPPDMTTPAMVDPPTMVDPPPTMADPPPTMEGPPPTMTTPPPTMDGVPDNPFG